MTLLTKLILIGVLLITSAIPTQAKLAMKNSLALYTVPSNYTKSSGKVDTLIYGGYLYTGIGNHSLDLEYDSIRDADESDEVQSNLLGIYTYYGIPTYRFKIGFQSISAETEVGSDGLVIISGISHDRYNYYGYKLWTGGVDLFYSNYDTTPQLDVYQVSPYFSLNFYPVYIKGLTTLTTKINHIRLSEKVGFDQKSATSAELTLAHFIGKWNVTTKLWTGEAIYGIYDGGFVVYNTNDRHLHGAGLSITHYLNKVLSLKAGIETHTLENTSGTRFNFTKSVIMATLSL